MLHLWLWKPRFPAVWPPPSFAQQSSICTSVFYLIGPKVHWFSDVNFFSGNACLDEFLPPASIGQYLNLSYHVFMASWHSLNFGEIPSLVCAWGNWHLELRFMEEGRCQGPLWDLFYKDTNPLLSVSCSWPYAITYEFRKNTNLQTMVMFWENRILLHNWLVQTP